jgi:hypothetical protein
MKIRLITRYAGPQGNWGPGQVADFPKADAEALIADGYAAAVKAGEAQVETAQSPAGAGQAEKGQAPAAKKGAKKGAKKVVEQKGGEPASG